MPWDNTTLWEREVLGAGINLQGGTLLIVIKMNIGFRHAYDTLRRNSSFGGFESYMAGASFIK